MDAERKPNDTAECVGKAVKTAAMVDYSRGAVVSKTLVDKKVGTLTLFAFDAGQGLSEHQAPYDAIVQIIDGTAKLTIGGQVVTAKAGEMVIMPANIPHSVHAEEKFKMMLVMIRAERGGKRQRPFSAC
jgi:quercetin dioxygenase-like cupin family protein